MKKWLKRSAIGLGLVAALAWAGASTYLYVRQGALIYAPTREWAKTPRDLGLAFEELRLSVKRASGTSENLNAWWVPAPAPNGFGVLFLHGNARNLGAATNAEKIAALARMGFNVLAIDYRGFGRSDGDAPYEAALYEDAQAALAEMQRRVPEASKRLLHGHSMGGAVAIDLAARQPGAFAAALIEASFTSMFEMSTLNPAYRVLPIDTLLTERFESTRKLPGVKLPMMFLHGTNDVRIPVAMSRSLFALAPEPKSLILVEGASHNNLHTYPHYREAYRMLRDMMAP